MRLSIGRPRSQRPPNSTPQPLSRLAAEGQHIEDKALIAVHEAGHAVIARVISHGVLRVSLKDGTHTRYRHGDHLMHLYEAMIALAGPLAEQRYRPTTPAERRALWRSKWHNDLEKARRHVEVCGGDAKWIARQVRKNWQAIERVATALQRGRELSGAELDVLMRGSTYRA
jgi:hypothetical protein